jgi:hypothetical protein
MEMTPLSMLWLPILVSSVIVFVTSAIIHMVSPWHKSDYPKLPNEDQVREALRPLALPPGDYMVPRPSGRDEMRSPEFAEKVVQGPNLVMTVLPNERWSMGRNLGLWMVYCIVVNGLAGFVAGSALPSDAPNRAIYHFVGLAAFIGYSLALWQMWIWYRRSGLTTLKSTIDGVIYAVLTAATFCWLWPR